MCEHVDRGFFENDVGDVVVVVVVVVVVFYGIVSKKNPQGPTDGLADGQAPLA